MTKMSASAHEDSSTRVDGGDGRHTRRVAGIPLGSWAFALRTWAAMMVALYVAFWLQLEGASMAATCVGILSLQSRGQVFSKAAYRTCGTIIGLAASLAIAGLFSQTRDLFFLAGCLWLGSCAFVASLLDGTPAYGAILSGYTVAIVAVPNVDNPLQTFSAAVNRGAAIAVGIAAVALINDVFLAPNLFPTVLGKLEDARARVGAFATKAMRDGGMNPVELAEVLKQVTALHPDIIALSAESVAGRARRSAACVASVSLLHVVSAARIATTVIGSLGDEGEALRERSRKSLDGRGDLIGQIASDDMAMPGESADRVVAEMACLDVAEHYRRASIALDALRDGRWSPRAPRLVLYKSRPEALLKGLRVGTAWGLASVLLSILSWPEAATALVQVGMMVGLSAINPSPRAFATAAVIAIACMVAAAFVTEFLILDGADGFPLLVLGMGPTIVVAALMLTTGKPQLVGIGFLMLVYFPQILAPANPQSYNPQALLTVSFLTVLATIALYLSLATILPASKAMQRGWSLRSARDDLRSAWFGTGRQRDLDGEAYRDADRIGQFGDPGRDHDQEADLASLIRTSDLAACARRIRAGLSHDRLRDRAAADRASAALAIPEPQPLREAGCELLRAEPSGARAGPTFRAAVDLLLAAALIERDPWLGDEIGAIVGR